MKNIPTLDEFLQESEELNEGIKLTIGNNYDVFEPGLRDWKHDMEYLGYDRNEKEHLFRDFESPGSSDVYILKISKKDEMKDIK